METRFNVLCINALRTTAIHRWLAAESVSPHTAQIYIMSNYKSKNWQEWNLAWCTVMEKLQADKTKPSWAIIRAKLARVKLSVMYRYSKFHEDMQNSMTVTVTFNIPQLCLTQSFFFCWNLWFRHFPFIRSRKILFHWIAILLVG